jgi:hypothetical protein
LQPGAIVTVTDCQNIDEYPIENAKLKEQEVRKIRYRIAIV